VLAREDFPVKICAYIYVDSRRVFMKQAFFAAKLKDFLVVLHYIYDLSKDKMLLYNSNDKFLSL